MLQICDVKSAPLWPMSQPGWGRASCSAGKLPIEENALDPLVEWSARPFRKMLKINHETYR